MKHSIARPSRARGIVALSLSIVLSIVAWAGVLTAPLTMRACEQKDVTVALRDADAGGKSLLAFAKQTYPEGDPRTAVIQKFSEVIHEVAEAYPKTTTAEGQIKLLPTFNFALDMFQQQIMPMLNVSPTARLIIFGIDVGLRIAANRFVQTAGDVVQENDNESAAAMDAAADAGIDAAAELERTKRFLATPKVKREP